MNYGLASCRLLCSILLLSMLPACVRRPGYTRQYLEPITRESMHFEEMQGDLMVRAKTYSKKERNRLFNNRGRHLKNIQAIQLAVTNDSEECWYITPQSFSCPLVHSHDLKKALTYWSGWRTFGVIAGGVVTGSILAASGFGLIAFLGGAGGSMAAVGLGYLAYATAGYFYLMTPIRTYTTLRHDTYVNCKINEDIRAKSFVEEIVIPPHSVVDTLIFVEAGSLNDQLRLILEDQYHDKATFEIYL